MKASLSVLFLATGLFIGLGALGHSFVGRLVVDAELAKFPIAFDVYSMLYVVWYFVGGCMALFGIITIWAWFRWRGGDTNLLVVTGLIGTLYFFNGAAGFFYRHHDPFMLLFLVQGAILVVCSAYFTKHPKALER
jgi:hypothetical protein